MGENSIMSQWRSWYQMNIIVTELEGSRSIRSWHNEYHYYWAWRFKKRVISYEYTNNGVTYYSLYSNPILNHPSPLYTLLHWSTKKLNAQQNSFHLVQEGLAFLEIPPKKTHQPQQKLLAKCLLDTKMKAKTSLPQTCTLFVWTKHNVETNNFFSRDIIYDRETAYWCLDY